MHIMGIHYEKHKNCLIINPYKRENNIQICIALVKQTFQ